MSRGAVFFRSAWPLTPPRRLDVDDRLILLLAFSLSALLFDVYTAIGADGGKPGSKRMVDRRKGGTQGPLSVQLREPDLIRPVDGDGSAGRSNETFLF